MPPASPTPQIHQPHLFHLAWSAALLAVGTNTGLTTCDHTVWLEASPDQTVFHASNVGCYVRAIIDTAAPHDGPDWRHVVHDPRRQVKDIASKCKTPNPHQPKLEGLDSQVLIHPEASGQHVQISYDDRLSATTVAVSVPVVDVEWPYEIVAIVDRHETDPTALMTVPPATFALVVGMAKLLGMAIPLSLNGQTAIFDVQPDNVEGIRVLGACATKAT